MTHAGTWQEISYPQTLPSTIQDENLILSEHGHVAYQIKRNREYSNMQAHILYLHIPSTP